MSYLLLYPVPGTTETQKCLLHAAVKWQKVGHEGGLVDSQVRCWVGGTYLPVQVNSEGAILTGSRKRTNTE